jgi:hypothetical protein
LAQNRRRRRKPSAPSGIVDEHKLTNFLAHQRVRLGISEILDHVHKVDALVHQIAPISGFLEPIALQITQKRDETEKIRTFFEKAVGATKGPLLYVEICGRVTPSMAAGVRNALVAVWIEVPRNAVREHRIAVLSNGHYEWLPPHPKPKHQGKSARRPKT